MSPGREICREAELLMGSRERFRVYLESTNDIIYEYDPQGVFVYVSPNWLELMGEPGENAIGRSLFNYLHPDYHELCREYLAGNSAFGGEIRNLEYQAKHSDGSWRWHLTNVTAIRDNNQQITGYVGIARDVTDRKLAELALAKSEKRYRERFEDAPVGIFTTSSGGHFLSCNSTMARMVGLPSPKDVTDYYTDIATEFYVNPQRRVEFLKELEISAQVEGFEFEAKMPDGRKLWFGMNARIAVHNDDGTFDIEGFLVDITRQKQALAESERLLSAIIQSGEIVVITDAEAHIQYVNPAFERITGYARQEVMGKNPKVLKSGEHDSHFYHDMWQALTSGKMWKGRLINKAKDGSRFIEDATISPIFDESGRIVNYVAVKHDMTEQLRISEEKARLEAQYQQAQKLESIGRLAGGVAHDLNNLLSPILGYGEMVLGELKDDDPNKGYVEGIVDAGFRARDLVSQLLAFSRKQVLEFKPVDLNSVLAKFETLLRRTIREDVNIRFHLQPSLPLIVADSGQLEQVVMNLAVNAQDAMPDGGTLTIETETTELDEAYTSGKDNMEPGRYVMLSVSDTGCGIDDEKQKHIFEPFYTTKEQGKGTGLGLSTVYGIVKQHNGNVWLYSELDKGTIFKVYFPVTKHTAEEEAIEQAKPVALEGTETILVAEDNSLVRKMIHNILVRYGYNVLIASGGREALDILYSAREPVDMLLTDVVMPELNGRDLYNLAAEKVPGLKVLFMSGYTDEVIAQHGIINKGVNYIQKPFSVVNLASKVREVLDRT